MLGIKIMLYLLSTILFNSHFQDVLSLLWTVPFYLQYITKLNFSLIFFQIKFIFLVLSFVCTSAEKT